MQEDDSLGNPLSLLLPRSFWIPIQPAVKITVYVCMCVCVCVCVCVCESLSLVQLFATPWMTVQKAPLSMGISRQEYWSGFPFPPPRNLPDLGIEPESLTPPALAARFFITSATWEAR